VIPAIHPAGVPAATGSRGVSAFYTEEENDKKKIFFDNSSLH
jgi:hypothetical protein